MAISVKTELLPITLNFDNGDSETFYCNANRDGFFDDVMSLKDRINDKIKKINVKDIKTDSSGNVAFDSDLEKLSPEEQAEKIKEIEKMITVVNEANSIFRTEIDKTLGENASAVIFKYNAPLSMHKSYGTYYFEGILTDIAREINRKVNSGQKQVMSAYTKKRKRK